MSRINRKNINRGISYFKRNGFKNSIYKVMERLERDKDEADYTSKALSNRPSNEELLNQKAHVFEHPFKISILVPVYETEPNLLIETIESVVNQSYGNWELCIFDASKSDLRRSVVNELVRKENKRCTDSFGSLYDKIVYRYSKENKGISGNTNEALNMATGDYIALLDHDDLLEPDALYEFMLEADKRAGYNRDSGKKLSKILVAYTDEDKISYDNESYFDCHLKPDFDPILLCTNNYICHFTIVDTTLARSVEGFHSAYDGAQDHDFVLRCTESIKRDSIYHIPKVLYHWRSTPSSTAENPGAKLYAYEAGKRAVKDHLMRMGVKAEVTDTPHMGFFNINIIDIPDMDDFVLIVSDELKAVGDNAINIMLSDMAIDEIGAVTGKIIGRNGRVESAGYDKMPNGALSPRFEGLNRNYSGYMHRANLQMISKGFSKDLVLLRKEAIKSMDGDIELKDGYDIIYEPRAVFKRRNV